MEEVAEMEWMLSQVSDLLHKEIQWRIVMGIFFQHNKKYGSAWTLCLPAEDRGIESEMKNTVVLVIIPYYLILVMGQYFVIV